MDENRKIDFSKLVGIQGHERGTGGARRLPGRDLRVNSAPRLATKRVARFSICPPEL